MAGAVAKLVAVVDDDESIRSALIPALQSVGLQALGFDSAESFMSFGRIPDVACLITDLKMPGMSGVELQAKLCEDGYRIPTIFIAAYGRPEARTQALAAGAIAFLEKPFDDTLLLENVRKIIEGGS